MKYLISLVFVLIPTFSFAWVVPGNPDICPSIGFHVFNQKLEGNKSEIDLPGDGLQRANMGKETREMDTMGIDFKIPVHSGVTFTLFYDQIDGEERFARSSNAYRENYNFDGYKAGFEARLYLGK